MNAPSAYAAQDTRQAVQLVPRELLARSDRILFIAHLALGDFTYLQNFFKAFSAAHPHLQVHLWVDEVRRTADASQWESLRTYSLYDWVAACPFFVKVYNRTYSPQVLAESIQQARQENYPVVVSLATLRPHQYARLARQICPDGFVAGMTAKPSLLGMRHIPAWRKLDARIPPYTVDQQQPRHISAVYADWFKQLFGLEVSVGQRFPFVDIPAAWRDYAVAQLEQWGFQDRSGKLVFINPFAKTRKRCWPLQRVTDLIAAMRQQPQWQNACFIVNAMPHDVPKVRELLEAHQPHQTAVFSAQDNFFQLPAILSECDLIISVETAIMHLANAVHVPVIALMRQKNPEWVPIDRQNSTVITAARRRDWVDAVTVNQVMATLPN